MDEFNKVFKRFYNRLALEGIIKASFIGIMISSVASAISSLILYIIGFNAIYIAIVVFFATLLLATGLVYFIKYKPTDKDVARRVDLEGLKERLITMVELKDNDSFMAQKQREDALAQLKRVQGIKIPFAFKRLNIILASVFLIVMLAANITIGVSLNGGLPSFDDIIDNNKPVNNVNVSYFEGEGGYIDGEIYQIVQVGTDTSEVVAVADDGYMFDIWSDGVTTPNRYDKNVQADIEVFAIFLRIEEDLDPSDGDDMLAPDDSQVPGHMPDGIPPHGTGAAGKYEEYNQVIDGNTYYRDVYKEFYDKAIEILNNGGKVPEYMRIIIEEYYETVK